MSFQIHLFHPKISQNAENDTEQKQSECSKRIKKTKKTCALLEAFKPKRNVVTGCPI